MKRQGRKPVTSQDAVRWAGIAAIIAAALIPFAALGRLLPDPTLALFMTIGNIGYVFLIFAFMGIGRLLADEIGVLGVLVVIAATVAAVLLIADGVVLAYVYPVFSEEGLVELQGSLGLALVSRLGPLALLAAAALLVLGTRRSRALPGRPAWIMLIGALLAALAGLIALGTSPSALAVIASLIFGAGLAWLGLGLLSSRPGAGR